MRGLLRFFEVGFALNRCGAGPSNGPHSFLPNLASRSFRNSQCVNALQRATLISTESSHQRRFGCYRCQCPPTGHTHFYRRGQPHGGQPHGVSMPSNGPHSFLHICTSSRNTLIGVSMPSNGPHSFLPNLAIYQLKKSGCQCPPTGNTHFYEAERRALLAAEGVSMPSNGPHSFLLTRITIVIWGRTSSVNALKQATLISTGTILLNCS